MYTFGVIVYQGQLRVYVGAGTKANLTEVGVIGQGIVCKEKLEGTRSQEEVPEPMGGNRQAVQLQAKRIESEHFRC